LGQLRAGVDIAVGVSGGSVGSAGTHTACVIGIIPGSSTFGQRLQLPAMLPSESAITEGFRIADLVIGDGFCAVTGQ